MILAALIARARIRLARWQLRPPASRRHGYTVAPPMAHPERVQLIDTRESLALDDRRCTDKDWPPVRWAAFLRGARMQ